MWNVAFEEKTLINDAEWSQIKTLWDGLEVHAFEYKVSGAGTIEVEVYTSISGEVWISNGVKVTGVGATSGPEGNGSDIIPLRLKPGDLIKFKTTASGTVTFSIWFTQK